jgi:hypothetical protein
MELLHRLQSAVGSDPDGLEILSAVRRTVQGLERQVEILSDAAKSEVGTGSDSKV